MFNVINKFVAWRRKSRRFLKDGDWVVVDRSKKTDTLVIILAGYKDFLWDYTLPRFASNLNGNVDVCLISSGLYSDELDRFSAENNWSYLYSKSNKISAVQNTAIKYFSSAEWIYKFDEDIFVSFGILGALKKSFLAIVAEGKVEPGLVSPMINVNGYSYIDFLTSRGLLGEYEREFGEIIRRGGGHKIQRDSNACIWVWEKSLPFEEISSEISIGDFNYAQVPHRYSIGAVLFQRRLWLGMGGFDQSRQGAGLGDDERHLCQYLMDASKTINVINNIFCGHFSFGPQERGAKEWFLKNKGRFTFEK